MLKLKTPGKITKKMEIKRLEYQPPGSYALDLEVFSVSNLRSRVGEDILSNTHRYSFYHLFYVTSGTCSHKVDFRTINCKPGSLLTVKPGQAHSFGFNPKWEGWMVLFRPELLATSQMSSRNSQPALVLENLYNHLELDESERKCILAEILQMREDTKIDASSKEVQELLRYKLSALILRLNIYDNQGQDRLSNNSKSIQRFKDFQQLVEVNFFKWHRLTEYVSNLGCSEKSLSRATQEAVGMNAKKFISTRIILEAKRLLAHTDLSVAAIGESLGFEETTNFFKFFKRETSCTPVSFRMISMVE